MTGMEGSVFHGLTLLKHCGGGAYGEVFFCRDISGKTMAVKIVSKGKLGEHWERELRGVSSYRRITGTSPDLLQIYHVEEDAEIFFYTMEAADSTDAVNYTPDTLAARLHSGALPQDELLPILNGILSGIKTIHAAGFAHRDIKPDNILFVNGKPKLGDIGLLSSLSSTMTQLAGTLDYLPPEILLGKSPDISEHSSRQKNDLYAFGKVIYCSVTGLSPSCFPSVPPDLQINLLVKLFLRLSFRLCDRTPEQRIETIAELDSELAEIQWKSVHGETNTDKIRYAFRMLTRSLRTDVKQLAHLHFSGNVLIALALLCLLPGKWLLGVLAKPDADAEQIASLIRNQRKNLEKHPDDIKVFSFCGERYTLYVPTAWRIMEHREFLEVLCRNYVTKDSPAWMAGNIRKGQRNTIALMYPDEPETVSRKPVVSLSLIPRTKEELAALSDTALVHCLKTFLGSTLTQDTVKRYVSPRTGNPVIMTFGHIAPDSSQMVYLYPQKEHTIALSLTMPEEYAGKNHGKFLVMADSFAKKELPPLRKTPDTDAESSSVLKFFEHAALFLHLKEKPTPTPAPVRKYPDDLLHYAMFGTPEDLDILQAEGADFQSPDSDGQTVFMRAVAAENFPNAEWLLAHGADVNASAFIHSTALHLAAEEERLNAVRFLLAHGIDTSAHDDFGSTALILASLRGSDGIVAELLKGKAELELRDNLQYTALCHAVANSHRSTVKRLLAAGADANAVTVPNVPLLLHAVEQDDLEILKLLLAAGVNLNAVNDSNETALLRALDIWTMRAKKEKHETALLLIKAGIDVNRQNSTGATALMYAANADDTELARILIEHGAKRELTDRRGNTAYFYCRQKENPELAKLLKVL